MDPESDLKSVNRCLQVVQMYKRGWEGGAVMCETMVFLASPPGKRCSPIIGEPWYSLLWLTVFIGCVLTKVLQEMRESWSMQMMLKKSNLSRPWLLNQRDGQWSLSLSQLSGFFYITDILHWIGSIITRVMIWGNSKNRRNLVCWPKVNKQVMKMTAKEFLWTVLEVASYVSKAAGPWSPVSHGDSVAGIQTRTSSHSIQGWTAHALWSFALLFSGSVDRPKELQWTSHLGEGKAYIEQKGGGRKLQEENFFDAWLSPRHSH